MRNEMDTFQAAKALAERVAQTSEKFGSVDLANNPAWAPILKIKAEIEVRSGTKSVQT